MKYIKMFDKWSKNEKEASKVAKNCKNAKHNQEAKVDMKQN